MSAWSVLVGNSTLPDDGINTSWLHLNNQSGGGGGGNVYLFGPATTNISDDATSTNIEESTSVANVTFDTLEANIIEDCT